MTWTAAIMSDDNLDPDSLVGRMLGVGELPPVLPEDESILPVLTEDVLNGEPPPLWRVMQEAYDTAPNVCMNQEGHCHAAEIEAVRDHIFPEEPEPETPGIPADKRWASLQWCCYRQRFRDRLTQQARIARGEA